MICCSCTLCLATTLAYTWDFSFDFCFLCLKNHLSRELWWPSVQNHGHRWHPHHLSLRTAAHHLLPNTFFVTKKNQEKKINKQKIKRKSEKKERVSACIALSLFLLQIVSKFSAPAIECIHEINEAQAHLSIISL